MSDEKEILILGKVKEIYLNVDNQRITFNDISLNNNLNEIYELISTNSPVQITIKQIKRKRL